MRNPATNTVSLAAPSHIGAVPMHDDTPRCLIPGQPHPAHDGMLTCRHHYQDLSRLLRTIEDETIHLETAPSMAIGYDRSSGGLASETAPARLDVIAYKDPRSRLYPTTPRPARSRRQAKRFGPWCLMCDHQTCRDWRAGRQRDRHDDEQDAGSDRIMSVLAVLHSWAVVVRDERALTAPTRVTVTGERDILSRHLEWVCRQPWVDEFYAELRGLAGQLERLNGSVEVAAGTCDTLYDGNECGGKVWHVMLKHPDGPDEPGFRCGRCKRVTTGTEAVRQRDRMWRAEQARKTGKDTAS